MRKKIKFIKNHNLVNRIYEMLKYFDIINYGDKKTVVNNIKDKLLFRILSNHLQLSLKKSISIVRKLKLDVI